MIKKLLVFTCILALFACCSDDDDPNNYIEGTRMAYNAKIKSTTYKVIERSYIAPALPKGEGTFTYNDNTYEFQVDFNDRVTVTKVVELKNPVAIIPAYIDDNPVRFLGKRLFYVNKTVEIVVCPETIQELLDFCVVATNAKVYIPDGVAVSVHNNIIDYTDYKVK